MKRLFNLLKGDILQQYKYGFYWLYLFVTLLYLIALYFFPDGWKTTVGRVIVLTDPMLFGYMFIGAIILFERSEKVTNALSVMPIHPIEYLFSKLISLGLISLLSSEVIMLGGGVPQHCFWTPFGILAGSFLFTMVGMIQACRISTLNGFIMWMIPTMLIAILPPILYLCGIDGWWQQLMPGTAILQIISNNHFLWLPSLVLSVYLLLAFWLAMKNIKTLLVNE
ncbi:MAG: hypothetical protein PHH23_05590 [Paludibacteraceae bacterium]|jgi:fluoroquinolone transport system permease protein|nr:hypothetical protein [Paludibacteraceae bacterium]